MKNTAGSELRTTRIHLDANRKCIYIYTHSSKIIPPKPNTQELKLLRKKKTWFLLEHQPIRRSLVPPAAAKCPDHCMRPYTTSPGSRSRWKRALTVATAIFLLRSRPRIRPATSEPPGSAGAWRPLVGPPYLPQMGRWL
jgi:hypothetical protein